MGQSVVALMYGIRSDTPGLRDDDGEAFWDYGAPKEKRAPGEFSPCDAHEGNVTGFAVASSGGCDDDENYLGEDCLLADIESVHAERIKEAREKWEKFAAWAKAVHGKKLPPAALWITTDERA